MRRIGFAAAVVLLIGGVVLAAALRPGTGSDRDSARPAADPATMDFTSSGVAGEVAGAVERVVRPGRARVAAAQQGDARSVCILVDGPDRYCELGAGLTVDDFPDLPRQGFREPPTPISRTMSIYRSVARRAMDYGAAQGDHIVVLLCPREEWDRLRLRWPAVVVNPARGPNRAAPADGSGLRPEVPHD